MFRVHRLFGLCLLSVLLTGNLIVLTHLIKTFATDENPCKSFAPHYISYLSWSPDGQWIAVACQENIVVYTGDLNFAFLLYGHTKTVNSLSWNPDSTLLASGSDDTTIRIWDIHSRKTVNFYRGHTEAVSNVRWSPDGTLIASTSADEISGENPDLQIFEPFANTLKYEIDTNIYDVQPAPYVDSIAWKPNSKQLAFAGNILGVGIWDLSLNEIVLKPEPMAYIFNLAWSPDGTKIALVGGGYPNNPDSSIWNSKTGTLLFGLTGHTNYVISVAWSPDGKYVATGSHDQSIKIWNGLNGQIVKLLSLHNSDNFMWPHSINWSPDSTRIAWILGEHEVCIADIDSIKNYKCVKIQNVEEF